MKFGMWDSLFNFLLLLFWFRIWTRRERDLVFNRYLAPIDLAADAIMRFLNPMFFGLSERFTASVALLFVIVFRAMVVPARGEWVLSLGMARAADTTSLVPCMIFSLLSFGAFLFKLWGLAFIFVRRERHAVSDQAAVVLHYISRPFTNIRVRVRPFVLLAFGMLLAAALDAAGARPVPAPAAPAFQAALQWQQEPVAVLGVKLAIIALAGWVELLSLLQSILLMLIVGSWISAFASAYGFAMFCREWIDLLLGPLRNHPIRVGPVDLTPIIFFFLVGFAYTILMTILTAGYNALA